VVTTTADSGPGSLRDAINQINADTAGNQYLGSHGVDEIDFAITAASDQAGSGTGFNANTGVATITPQSGLPTIVNPVFIDGYTQGQGTSFPASATLAVGDNAVIDVVLDGGPQLAGTIPEGLLIGGGSSTVQGLVAQNFHYDIDLESGQNLIAGDNLQNPGGGPGGLYRGVFVNGSGNTIGGTLPAARNVISISAHSGAGIQIYNAPGTVVEGNYIGTNAAGTSVTAGPRSIGVWVGSNDNTIGGTAAAARNVISGWGLMDVQIGGGTGNIVEGNYVGTDASGTVTLPGTGFGVFLNGGSGNTIGGTAQGAGNVISVPGRDGIEADVFNGASAGNGNAIDGNIIANNGGAGVHVVSGTGFAIQENSIYGNGQLGIVLGNGLNTNASNNQANHQGPNNLMNFPVLTSVQTSAAGTIISGTLDTGTANGLTFLPTASITLDFYADPPAAVDASGYGQGETWLGSMTVTTDANGHATFTSPQFNIALPAGDFVTATATDATGDTSEFSADIPVGPTSGGPYTVIAGGSATFHAAAGPGTTPTGYFWLVNGQQYGSTSSSTGYNPTLTWAQLQALGVTGPGQYSVEAEWYNGSGTVTPLLPATTLTVETAPVTAAITTALPSDDSGNATATAGTGVTVNSTVTDPNTGNAVGSYAWSVVEHAEPTPLGTPSALMPVSEYATRDLGESSGSGSAALGAPDQNGWPPAYSDSAPYLTVGFNTPTYADGVSVCEFAGAPNLP
jgi:hypothetical protein